MNIKLSIQVDMHFLLCLNIFFIETKLTRCIISIICLYVFIQIIVENKNKLANATNIKNAKFSM